MVQILDTWTYPPCGHCWKVSEVSQVKNSDRSLQFQEGIGNDGLMSIQLSSPCVVFCLSNMCQHKIYTLVVHEVWGMSILICTCCGLCPQLWSCMHSAFCLTSVFFLSFAALLQAVISGDLLKVGTEHWVPTYSQFFSSQICCTFYYTSAQIINRLLWGLLASAILQPFQETLNTRGTHHSGEVWNLRE